MRHQQPRRDDINERALVFVCRVLDFVPSIPSTPGTRRVADQLVDSAGSVGSNLEEAIAASSRREFVRFNETSLRESRESNFWLKVCQRSRLGNATLCKELLDEGLQIARIIAAIVINTKRNGL
jgi:four helix bundle protein